MPPHRRLIMPPQRRLSSIGMHRLHLLNAAAQRRQVNLQPSVLEDYIIDETVDPLVQEQWHYDQWPTGTSSILFFATTSNVYRSLRRILSAPRSPRP